MQASSFFKLHRSSFIPSVRGCILRYFNSYSVSLLLLLFYVGLYCALLSHQHMFMLMSGLYMQL